MKGNEEYKEILIILDTLGGKWKPIIISTLYYNGTMRFNALKRSIPNITQRMLTLHLKELEEHDIINRVVYSQIPPKVEYSLTEYGRTIRPLWIEMYDWGEKHLEHLAQKQISEKDLTMLSTVEKEVLQEIIKLYDEMAELRRHYEDSKKGIQAKIEALQQKIK